MDSHTDAGMNRSYAWRASHGGRATSPKRQRASYLDCIHDADVALLARGVQTRAALQRSDCAGGAVDAPAWFCRRDARLTLARFEKVNFALFLSALDFDDAAPRRLTALETARAAHITRARASGAAPAAAAAEGAPFDEAMLRTMEGSIRGGVGGK